MSGLRWITCWGNKGALRAFGKGFVLRSAFRGKPVGSLRPRSSGIKLMRIRCASRLMRSAARASCGVCLKVNLWRALRCPVFGGLLLGGDNGALRAFGKGFVLRNAFRGRPIGSLRPRSSGIGAGENWVRFVRFGWGLSRWRVWRFAPRVLSIGIEMHVALLALRL